MSALSNKQKIRFGLRILQSRLFGKRFPLAVSWHITKECNMACRYCGIADDYEKECSELSTDQVCAVIDDLAVCGTKIISFCGGEPLLRADMHDIVAYCRKRNIAVQVISNGVLVPERIAMLKSVALLKVSFDGPQEVHDHMRGAGSHAAVMKALDAARCEGVPCCLSTTVHAYNSGLIDEIVAFAEKRAISVSFSPLKNMHARDKNIQSLFADDQTLQRSFARMIELSGVSGSIRNSVPALRYMAEYPDTQRIPFCAAGRIFCHLKPNGDMTPCEMKSSFVGGNACRDGARKSFQYLDCSGCDRCWCMGTLDLTMVYLLSLGAIKKCIN